MSLNNSRQYLEKYTNLRNGYYDYKIDGIDYNLYTMFEDNSGWIKVVTVNAENNFHLTEESVIDVKLHDGIINQLRTDYEYNVMASAIQFKLPYNEWLRYPHNMYVHKTMEHFSSVKSTIENPGSNFISFDVNKPPMTIRANDTSLGFGNGTVGDTVFAYGRHGYNGFFQSFSGAGYGAVYVR